LPVIAGLAATLDQPRPAVAPLLEAGTGTIGLIAVREINAGVEAELHGRRKPGGTLCKRENFCIQLCKPVMRELLHDGRSAFKPYGVVINRDRVEDRGGLGP
jgi:hypothetical protein